MLWRQIQKNNFTDLNELLDFLNMSLENKELFLDKHPFVLNLPQRLAGKIKKNDPQDPLLLQFLPLKEELIQNGEKDPCQDQSFQKTSNLLQKYKSRSLIVTTSACAMHCRYCFRKNYPYTASDYQEEIEHIRLDSSCEEVLLSGGDPLSLSDQKLFSLLDELDEIDHLKRIRFHTRFLIGIPERIHEGFLKKLSSIKKQIIFVIHINHARELDEDIFNVCKQLQRIGVPVLTQTVLLKGVNDSPAVLVDLFKSLINQGIIPYYLHQFDPVEGGMHFEVPIEKGLAIINELRKELPGYAVPTYVKEIPGRSSKTPISDVMGNRTLHSL